MSYADHHALKIEKTTVRSELIRQLPFQTLDELAEIVPVLEGMPADYFKFDPLGKRTFGTVDEFERALRTKGRLGAYL